MRGPHRLPPRKYRITSSRAAIPASISRSGGTEASAAIAEPASARATKIRFVDATNNSASRPDASAASAQGGACQYASRAGASVRARARPPSAASGTTSHSA